MKKILLLLPMIGLALSGCRMINESMQALEYNRYQIDENTEAINRNAQAIEYANTRIEENRRQLEGVNQVLQKVQDSEKS